MDLESWVLRPLRVIRLLKVYSGGHGRSLERGENSEGNTSG